MRGCLRELGAGSILGGEFETAPDGAGAAAWRPAARRRRRAAGLARAAGVRYRPTAPACRRSARYARLRRSASELRRPATPKPAAAASTCAGTARSFRSTTERSAWCSARWCWKTSGSRWRRARGTSPSAIPISSTAPATPCASSKRSTPSFPTLTYDVTIKVEHLLHHRDLLPLLKRHRLPVRHQRGGIGRRRRARASWTKATRARISSRWCALMRERGLALAPTFRAVHAVDHARRLPRPACETAGRTGPGGEHGAPIQLAIRLSDPGGLAAAGTAGSARDGRPFDPRRWRIPGSTTTRRWTRSPQQLQQLVKLAARAPTPAARRSSAKIWAAGGCRRAAGLPPLPARGDSHISPNPGTVERSPTKSSWLFYSIESRTPRAPHLELHASAQPRARNVDHRHAGVQDFRGGPGVRLLRHHNAVAPGQHFIQSRRQQFPDMRQGCQNEIPVAAVDQVQLDVGIVNPDFLPLPDPSLDRGDDRTLPQVVRIFLEGQAEDADPRSRGNRAPVPRRDPGGIDCSAVSIPAGAISRTCAWPGR